MKPKLTAKEALTLYGVGITVAFGFFLLGLNWGALGNAEAGSSGEQVPVAPAPRVSETTTRLDLYTAVAPKQDSPVPSQPLSDQMAEGVGVSKAVEPLSPSGSRPTEIPSTLGEALTIQVGALSTEAEARQLLVRLEARGYSGILDMPKPGDKYYRVRVGAYATRDAARRAEALLKSEGFLTYIKKIDLGGQGR